MTTKELANRCGCSTTYIFDLRRIGKIGSEKVIDYRGKEIHKWDAGCIPVVIAEKGKARERLLNRSPSSENKYKRITCPNGHTVKTVKGEVIPRPCIIYDLAETCGTCHLCERRFESCITTTSSMNDVELLGPGMIPAAKV